MKDKEEKITNKDRVIGYTENSGNGYETEMADVDLQEYENGKNGNNTHEETDDSEIETDINDLIPTPPDGGWGWVIVLSSFMSHFILDGISYAFGSFIVDYKNYFKSSTAMTSTLMSCLVGCYMLSGTVRFLFYIRIGNF